MQYIVLDMEWNQPWPGSAAARRPLPSPLRGEIIQIGAVRVTEDRKVLDEFSVLVRPKYFRRLNSRVGKLTGIKESRLQSEGISFPQAIARFRAWCAEPSIFLTWGFDDVNVMRENLEIHSMNAEWTAAWYNAQMIFNAQTDGSSNQKSLQKAMEIMNIRSTRPAHDALGDAFHTALICSKLDLKKGIDQYGSALRQHEDGTNSDDIPGCLQRRVYRDYREKSEAVSAMEGSENLCPVCGAQMRMASRWYRQQSGRMSARVECPEHGNMVLRLRWIQLEDYNRLIRTVYEGDSEAAASFEALTEKERPSRRRRRGRRGGSSRKKKPDSSDHPGEVRES
ncbi:MAG: exonuclease domain-containing protein [Oscillospiraceae bacterium]|nr:exonuclease domain-containing protein [Oscillospiraceae bacterium]